MTESTTPSLSFRVGDAHSADYDRFADLLNVVEGRNLDSDTLRAWDANQTAKDIHIRFAACLGHQVIGYGVIYHDAIDATSRFLVWLTIDSAYRKQGHGRRFYEFLEQKAIEHGATDFGTECMDNDPESLAFAEKLGFEIEGHWFASKLDLTTFNMGPLLPVVEKVKAQGLRFSSLDAEGNTDVARRKLFDLNALTAQDNPGNRGEYHNTFENFEAKVLNARWFRADGQILAVDGERFVGLGAIGFESDGITAFNAFTGVHKDYRGRGIAQALKILGAQYAKSNGATVVTTSNDSKNAPMLAINDKLGYVRQPGPYWLVKQMI